jgi:hypothetical protein
MSGTFTAKVLAEGQVASTKGTLYTVPASTKAYVKSITFYNTNAATQTLNVYLKPGATSRQIYRVSLAQYATYELTVPYLLEAADLIEADTTTGTAVDYVITGVEET